MPSLGDYSTDLTRALDRLAHLGADLRRGRFRTYEDTLRRAADDPAELDPVTINASIAEAVDLSSIAALPDECLLGHLISLEHIAHGETIYTNAGDDDPGRQTAFPFIVGSRFNLPDSQITFENPSDVVVDVAGTRILIECKRVRTQAALGRRLRQGYRQMSEHRRVGNVGLGVIAIEISSILNPDFFELAVPEPAEPMDGLNAEVEVLFGNAREHLHRAARNRRLDAQVDVLLFRAQCFIRRPGGNWRACGTSWRAQPTAEVGSPRFAAINGILERIPAFVPTVQTASVDRDRA